MLDTDCKIKWDELSGTTECIILSKQYPFAGIGTSQCMECDQIIKSQKVGTEIAHARARIDFLKKYRDFVIIPSLSAIKEIHYNMQHSERYNPNSYEAKTIKKKLTFWQEERDITKQLIIEEKIALSDYIERQESFKEKLQKLRAK